MRIHLKSLDGLLLNYRIVRVQFPHHRKLPLEMKNAAFIPANQMAGTVPRNIPFSGIKPSGAPDPT
jgi:hypothetical protein